jgi:hypothetical protein
MRTGGLKRVPALGKRRIIFYATPKRAGIQPLMPLVDCGRLKNQLRTERRRIVEAKERICPGECWWAVRVLLVFLLPLGLPLAGATEEKLAADATKDECARTADRFVAERLRIWQSRLRLNDWKISIAMTHAPLLRPNTLGNVQWDADEKTAVIRVLDGADYQVGCRDMLDDMEFTVVHELLHLKLSTLPRSEASRRDEEFAVNHITNALLSLDRRR